MFDLGVLGSTEGEGETIHVNPFTHLSSLLPWLAAVLLLLLPENRGRGVWVVLLAPVATRLLLPTLGLLAAKLPASVIDLLGRAMVSLALASTILLLLGRRLTSKTPGSRRAMGLGVLATVVLASELGSSLAGPMPEMLTAMGIYSLAAAVLAVGIRIARRRSREPYNFLLFALWSLAGIVLACVVIYGGYLLVWFSMVARAREGAPQVLAVECLLAGALTCGLYAVVLPFAILGLAHAPCKHRIEAHFGLTAPVAEAPPSDGGADDRPGFCGGRTRRKGREDD